MTEPKASGPCNPPPITFATFVLSLAQAVMDQLEQAGSSPEQAAQHLQLAQQSIDLLELLECKTKGNLDQDEAQLLSTLLYEVRMGFLAASKRA
jgi:hypothetical protein